MDEDLEPRRNAVRAYAFHEAGHALLAVWLRVPVSDVEIYDDGSLHGVFKGGQTDDPVAAGKIALGGPHAEKMYQDEEIGGHFPLYYNAPQDREAAVASARAAVAYSDGSLAELLADWRLEVDERLLAGWDQLTVVAEQLERRRRLTGDEVAEILASANAS